MDSRKPLQILSHISKSSSSRLLKSKTNFFKHVVASTHFNPPRPIPSDIEIPIYANTGKVPNPPKEVEIKTKEQIDTMRKACQLARKVAKHAKNLIKVGVTLEELDSALHHSIIGYGAYPSPLNYKGFPKSVCTSVNHVAVHGIPDSYSLKDGDIISVDISEEEMQRDHLMTLELANFRAGRVGLTISQGLTNRLLNKWSFAGTCFTVGLGYVEFVYLDGVHGDLCETFFVGNVDDAGCKLVDISRKCLDAAINQCGPGVRFSTIGNTISSLARKHGFSVSPYCNGHGIGSVFHALPDICHVENNYPGKMEPGMTFTIEPVIHEGLSDIQVLDDGWTMIATDGKRVSQFEETILITDTGVEVLTDKTSPS